MAWRGTHYDPYDPMAMCWFVDVGDNVELEISGPLYTPVIVDTKYYPSSDIPMLVHLCKGGMVWNESKGKCGPFIMPPPSLEPPEPPLSVNAYITSWSTAEVQWLPSTKYWPWFADTEKYLIYRIQKSSGKSETYSSLPFPEVRFSDNGLEPNTEYYYEVISVNSSGMKSKSADSNVILTPDYNPLNLFVLSRGFYSIDILYVNSILHLKHKAELTRSESKSIGGGLFPSNSPAAVSWGSGRLDAFVTLWDRSLYHKYWNGKTWKPSETGWNTLDFKIARATSPTAVSWGPNRFDVFAVGMDGERMAQSTGGKRSVCLSQEKRSHISQERL